LNELYRCAHQLGCKGLQKSIAAYLGCLVKVSATNESVKNRLKELNIKGQLSAENVKEYKNRYPFMNWLIECCYCHEFILLIIFD